MESRAKAGTGNIINSLKGLYLQPLQRLFAFASAEFTPAFYGATKSSDKEHLLLVDFLESCFLGLWVVQVLCIASMGGGRR